MIDTGAGTAENYPVFSVAGGRARNQNFILDGGNASNAVGGAVGDGDGGLAQPALERGAALGRYGVSLLSSAWITRAFLLASATAANFGDLRLRTRSTSAKLTKPSNT